MHLRNLGFVVLSSPAPGSNTNYIIDIQETTRTLQTNNTTIYIKINNPTPNEIFTYSESMHAQITITPIPLLRSRLNPDTERSTLAYDLIAAGSGLTIKIPSNILSERIETYIHTYIQSIKESILYHFSNFLSQGITRVPSIVIDQILSGLPVDINQLKHFNAQPIDTRVLIMNGINFFYAKSWLEYYNSIPIGSRALPVYENTKYISIENLSSIFAYNVSNVKKFVTFHSDTKSLVQELNRALPYTFCHYRQNGPALHTFRTNTLSDAWTITAKAFIETVNNIDKAIAGTRVEDRIVECLYSSRYIGIDQQGCLFGSLNIQVKTATVEDVKDTISKITSAYYATRTHYNMPLITPPKYTIGQLIPKQLRSVLVSQYIREVEIPNVISYRNDDIGNNTIEPLANSFGNVSQFNYSYGSVTDMATLDVREINYATPERAKAGYWMDDFLAANSTNVTDSVLTAQSYDLYPTTYSIRKLIAAEPLYIAPAMLGPDQKPLPPKYYTNLIQMISEGVTTNPTFWSSTFLHTQLRRVNVSAVPMLTIQEQEDNWKDYQNWKPSMDIMFRIFESSYGIVFNGSSTKLMWCYFIGLLIHQLSGGSPQDMTTLFVGAVDEPVAAAVRKAKLSAKGIGLNALPPNAVGDIRHIPTKGYNTVISDVDASGLTEAQYVELILNIVNKYELTRIIKLQYPSALLETALNDMECRHTYVKFAASKISFEQFLIVEPNYLPYASYMIPDYIFTNLDTQLLRIGRITDIHIGNITHPLTAVAIHGKTRNANEVTQVSKLLGFASTSSATRNDPTLPNGFSSFVTHSDLERATRWGYTRQLVIPASIINSDRSTNVPIRTTYTPSNFPSIFNLILNNTFNGFMAPIINTSNGNYIIIDIGGRDPHSTRGINFDTTKYFVVDLVNIVPRKYQLLTRGGSNLKWDREETLQTNIDIIINAIARKLGVPDADIIPKTLIFMFRNSLFLFNAETFTNFTTDVELLRSRTRHFVGNYYYKPERYSIVFVDTQDFRLNDTSLEFKNFSRDNVLRLPPAVNGGLPVNDPYKVLVGLIKDGLQITTSALVSVMILLPYVKFVYGTNDPLPRNEDDNAGDVV